MKIMATSFKRSHAHTAPLSAPDPASGHRQPMPPPETPGHSQASLGQSVVGSLLFSSGSQGFVCALQECVSLVLCKFWRFYGGVNGDLLEEGLCHTQVCCTQSQTSARDTQTLKGRLAQSLWGSPGGLSTSCWNFFLCLLKISLLSVSQQAALPQGILWPSSG